MYLCISPLQTLCYNVYFLTVATSIQFLMVTLMTAATWTLTWVMPVMTQPSTVMGLAVSLLSRRCHLHMNHKGGTEWQRRILSFSSDLCWG